MSSNVNQHSDYLQLLLSSDYNQQKALLFTASLNQLDVLSEIFHNFLILPLTQEEKSFLKGRKQLVEKLADITKSYRFRKSLINKHYRQVLKSLLFFKERLLSVLS